MTEETIISTEPEAQVKVLHFGRTGFFRDGIRRIDLVLVVEDDGNLKLEELKIEYLTNVVKFGLQLELEPGVMAIHKNLIFIKVHAPESIVEEYGRKFEISRYFKQAHVEFVNPKGIIRRLLKYIPIPLDYTGLYEREWIKIVRRKNPQPKRFSTLDRSIIVNKLLHSLPFGDHENYVGLHKLLQQRLVLDVFALHDGPYFAVPGQFPAEYNARQDLPEEIQHELNITRERCRAGGNDHYSKSPDPYPYAHSCDDFLETYTWCNYQGPEFLSLSTGNAVSRIPAEFNHHRAIWYRRQLAAHYLLKQVSLTVLVIIILFNVIPARQSDIEQTEIIQKAIIEMK